MIDPSSWRTVSRIAAGLALAVIVIWLMRALESVTTLVLVAFFVAYILDPATDRIEALGVRRSLAAFVVIFGGLFLALGALLFIVPKILRETSLFAGQAHTYFSRGGSQLVPLLDQAGYTLPSDWQQVTEVLQRAAPDVLPRLKGGLHQALGTITRSALELTAVVVHVALVPVLVYYFLVPFQHIKEVLASLVPAYNKDLVLGKLREIDSILAAFVRGQLTICLLMGLMYTVAFLVIGIDLAVVLGLTSGALFIIPYLGTVLALSAGSVMALAKFGDPIHVLYVVAAVAVIQVLESYIITPKIVGEAVGLQPGAYILALLIGAELFGIVGMLLAVPTAAVIKVLLATAVDYYRASILYSDPPLEER